LVLKGRVVSGDAIFCQREICRDVVGEPEAQARFSQQRRISAEVPVRARFFAALSGDAPPTAAKKNCPPRRCRGGLDRTRRVRFAWGWRCFAGTDCAVCPCYWTVISPKKFT
jgi:hypothetical protein